MNNTIRIFYILISTILFVSGTDVVVAQQDAQYSQYMFNQLALNPAYAGSKDILSSTLLYRKQWTALKGAPTTSSFSIQSPFANKKMGWGAEIISDKLGPKHSSALLGSYSYRVRFAKGKLSFGLRTGIYNYVIDWNDIDYKDKNDFYNSQNKTSKITGTADFGMYYYTYTFYLGMGFNHLNRGRTTPSGFTASSRQALHFFMPIGKAFVLGNTIFNPSLLLKTTHNAGSDIDLNLNFLIKDRLWLGLSLRSKYGVVFLTHFLINDYFKIGYSYDAGGNKIGIAGKGTHEIMIGYDLNKLGAKILMPRFL